MAGKSNIVRIAFVADAVNKVKAQISSIGGAAAGTAKQFSGASTAVLTALTAQSVAAVAFGKSCVSAFTDAAAATKNLQRQFGGTAEEASRFAAATSMLGIDTDALSLSLKTFAKQVAADKAGVVAHTSSMKVWDGTWSKQTKTVQDASGKFRSITTMVKNFRTETAKTTTSGLSPMMKSLGVNTRDASGGIRSLYDLLPEIADKFKSMPAGAERTALALKLFGRQGQAMLPFLLKGAAGIKELEDQADSLGLTLSGKDLAAQTKYVAAQREWSASIRGIKMSIGRELLPVMTQLLQNWTRQLPALRAWVAKALPGIKAVAQLAVTHLKRFGDMLQYGLNILSKYQSNAAPAVTALLGVALAVKAVNLAMKAWAVTTKLFNPWIIAIAAIAVGLAYAYKHSTAFRAAVDQLWARLKAGARTIAQNVVPVLSHMWASAVSAARKAWPYISTALSAIGHAAQALWKVAGPVLSRMWDGATRAARAAWPYVVTGWRMVVAGAKGAVTTIGAVWGAFKAVASVVGAIVMPPLRTLWALISGLFTAAAPLVKALFGVIAAAVGVAVVAIKAVVWALTPLFNTLVTGAKAMWAVVSPVVLWFSSKLPALAAVWGQFWAGLTLIIKNTFAFWTGLTTLFGKAVGVMTTAVSSMIEAAVTAVAGAVRGFFELGGKIVNGIIGGIKDAWGGLTDMLSRLVSFLPDGVRKFLGLSSSPAKLTSKTVSSSTAVTRVDVGSPITTVGAHSTRETTVAVIKGIPRTEEAKQIIAALQEHCRHNGPISGVKVRMA